MKHTLLTHKFYSDFKYLSPLSMTKNKRLACPLIRALNILVWGLLHFEMALDF